MHEQSSTAQVVRSYLEAFATGDADHIAGHVTDDFVNEHTAALGKGCETRAEYRRRLPGFLADMVGLRYEIEHLVVEGNNAMVAYRMHAAWQGGAPVNVRGAQYLAVRDGLVAHRTDYWDSAAFLLQASPEAAVTLRGLGMT